MRAITEITTCIRRQGVAECVCLKSRSVILVQNVWTTRTIIGMTNTQFCLQYGRPSNLC